VSWLWALSKLEPLIPAHVTLPYLCDALSHVYIVHISLFLAVQRFPHSLHAANLYLHAAAVFLLYALAVLLRGQL